MKPLSKHEEDYLKAVFHLNEREGSRQIGSKDLAEYLEVSPASVSSMLKKLKDKLMIEHSRYGKIALSALGRDVAVILIRKHRLWETFLHDHMNFTWDEVHDVAEQLEHIKSVKLVQELDRFLGFPEKDPHGEPIPTEEGDYQSRKRVPLSSVGANERCKLESVDDGSVSFLRVCLRNRPGAF